MIFHSAILISVFMTLSVGIFRDRYSPIVPMTSYPASTRILDCWQCFEAMGQMCYNRHYKNMFKYTGSGNKGLGICKRPDNNFGEKDPDIICSHNSYDP